MRIALALAVTVACVSGCAQDPSELEQRLTALESKNNALQSVVDGQASRIVELESSVEVLQQADEAFAVAATVTKPLVAPKQWIVWQSSRPSDPARLYRPGPAKAIDALPDRETCITSAAAFAEANGGAPGALTFERQSATGAYISTLTCLPEGTPPST